MLVQQMKDHFDARLTEWVGALGLSAWGLYVLKHPDLMSRPGFAGLAALAVSNDPETLWGSIATVVGIVRACALFVNGAYSRTPVIRVVTSAISAFTWFTITFGFWIVGDSTGIIMYGIYGALLDFISGYRAGRDVVIAEHARRVRMGVKSRGRLGRYCFPDTA